MSKYSPISAPSILAMILLLATFSTAENVTVEPNPKVVGPHLRLTVHLHGNPLKDVKLIFYNTQDELKFVRVSDAGGQLSLPSLQSGVYRIEARFEDAVVANAYVKVIKDSKVQTFTLDLTREFDAHQAWLEGVEKLPIAASVKEFVGTVFDPSNAPIPNADIRVERRGMKFANKVVLRLRSDAEGHFSAQLEPGEYIAFFSEAGFKTTILPFALTNQGEAALQVVLNIGSITENVMVSANRIQ